MPGVVLPLLLSERPGARIWWLETDRQLCRLVEEKLTACGWQVSFFHRPTSLVGELQRSQPDLLLLERFLLGADDLAFLRQLHRRRDPFPMLILSGMAAPEHRIEGLQAGASDYLAKPFRIRELVLRIERLLLAVPVRPIHLPAQGGSVPVGPLSLEPARGTLRSATGAELPLSRGDRALLLALLQAPGGLLSREQLAQATGSLVDVSTSRTLDVRLSRLRRHLRALSHQGVSIEAVRGRGYRLTFPAPSTSESEPA